MIASPFATPPEGDPDAGAPDPPAPDPLAEADGRLDAGAALAGLAPLSAAQAASNELAAACRQPEQGEPPQRFAPGHEPVDPVLRDLAGQVVEERHRVRWYGEPRRRGFVPFVRVGRRTRVAAPCGSSWYRGSRPTGTIARADPVGAGDYGAVMSDRSASAAPARSRRYPWNAPAQPAPGAARRSPARGRRDSALLVAIAFVASSIGIMALPATTFGWSANAFSSASEQQLHGR